MPRVRHLIVALALVTCSCATEEAVVQAEDEAPSKPAAEATPEPAADTAVTAADLESTAILVTSDHGEEFLDHDGVGHGHSLYQEQIRIPMVLRPPGGVAPQRIAGAQQVDVTAMLAALAGVALPPTAVGRDLLSAGDLDRRPVFSEQEVNDRRLWSFVEGGMKLHYNRNATHAAWQGRETHELFDLETDAGEQHNLYASRPIVAGFLLERARALAAQFPSAAERNSIRPKEMSEEMLEELRALGYLQ